MVHGEWSGAVDPPQIRKAGVAKIKRSLAVNSEPVRKGRSLVVKWLHLAGAAGAAGVAGVAEIS